MKKNGLLWAMLIALSLMLFAAPALADKGWTFEEKTVTLFEGDAVWPEILREGEAAEEGEITWVSSNPKAVTVSEEGEVKGLKKGKAQVTAQLKIGKKKWKTVMSVTVLRRVTRVTLSTKKMQVYAATDPAVSGLLRQATEHQVIVIPAGRNVQLKAVCTPEDASDTRVTFTTDDAGVARVDGGYLRAEQAGECDLTLTSVQNPEVTETLRVLVIQPVKKITLSAGNRKVAVGSTLQISAAFEPAEASVREVRWSSRNPTLATVDENGVVTGLKKGNAVIDAVAEDGSGVKGSITISVTKTAEAISLDKTETEVVVKGNPVYLRATISPADTSDKSVHWDTSDPEIATVENGKITGHKAGECTVTARSLSDPDLTVTALVHVVQRVTKITFDSTRGTSLLVGGDAAQLVWTVEPADATNKEVTFSSNHPNIVSVDQEGVVIGHKRGAAMITAKATDKSGKAGQVRVTVIQPVEGVQLKAYLHHVQLYDEYHRATALTIPKDANNQNMRWSTGDPMIATARGTGNACYITGNMVGDTTLTVVTEDGGFTAQGEIRVRDYNGAVLIEGLEVTSDNRIRIVLRNMSDFTIARVNFRIDCYDRDGNPMVCNTDGESTFFEGSYSLGLDPGMRSEHGQFNFRNAAISDPLGMVVLTVTRYTDLEGYTWDIPENARVPRNWDWRIQTGWSDNG